MTHQIARCPHCGAILAQEPGSAAEAIDNLYREVARLREIAETRRTDGRPAPAQEALPAGTPGPASTPPAAREAALVEEIRLLRATVARLRATSRVTST